MPNRDEGQHECFDLDGARVHGDPNMSEGSRNALREIIDAAKRRMAETQCRCVWRDERCGNQATEEDGLCNWCGDKRTEQRLRKDPAAHVGPDGTYFGLSGRGQTHDYDVNRPASTAACWYPDADRVVLDA